VSAPEGKRRLGRGLEALLGVSVEEAEREGSLRELPVSEIRPNRYQPRRAFDAAALKELKDSIAANGLLQPIVVRPGAREGYELVAGERRWRAVKELGWKKVPAVIRDVDEQTLLTLALVENLQRASLSPIDEAEGYERLARDFSLTHAQIAHAVGRDRSTIANAVRLLELPKPVQALLDQGALSAGHARALLSLDDDREIARLAREAVAHGWSVRETERQTRGDGKRGKPAKKARRALPPEARRIEEVLRKKLGTDVAVVLNGKQKGHVAIRFYSSDDLARLMETILGRRWDG
jgi:ParB family transcriptional regulator, chromosome partitioning protein